MTVWVRVTDCVGEGDRDCVGEGDRDCVGEGLTVWVRVTVTVWVMVTVTVVWVCRSCGNRARVEVWIWFVTR